MDESFSADIQELQAFEARQVSTQGGARENIMGFVSVPEQPEESAARVADMAAAPGASSNRAA